ncbi:MAG: histidine kinase [Ignavibacteria bacterium RBG_16_36_9]|nr:MAG: histidine kinase [Ignavibacteria bacterium RBG_16_36_9]
MLIVVLTIVVFIIVDLALRLLMKRIQEAKIRKEREMALNVGLKLDYTDEAKSLKRVEVKNPKAKILAVDDEKIILDSFRKILVFGGYSIDTVETGKEALGLIKKYDYDFVFTDLKMPELDGVDVTKAVKHLRPDIDVIVITGYAAIETAVETMKFGAMDYVQKPFTEDELIEFVNKSLIKRQDKIERQMKPDVRLITSSIKESDSKHEFNVPAGIFVANNHIWVNIEMNGTTRFGVDDFVRKIIGKIDEVMLPEVNQKVKKGELLFSLRHNTSTIHFTSPISGKISLLNTEHVEHPEWIVIKPFELSWMCCIEPSNLSDELHSLKIGDGAISWYKEEIEKYNEIVTRIQKENLETKSFNEKIIDEFCKTFFNK